MKKVLIYYKKWKITKKNYTGTMYNTNSFYKIKSLASTYITESNLKAITVLLKKVFKKKAYFHNAINKQKILTKKSLGMRMGKGKGNKKSTIFLVNKGNFILSIKISKLRNIKDLKLFISILKRKLSFPIQICITKNKFLDI